MEWVVTSFDGLAHGHAIEQVRFQGFRDDGRVVVDTPSADGAYPPDEIGAFYFLVTVRCAHDIVVHVFLPYELDAVFFEQQARLFLPPLVDGYHRLVSIVWDAYHHAVRIDLQYSQVFDVRIRHNQFRD